VLHEFDTDKGSSIFSAITPESIFRQEGLDELLTQKVSGDLN